MVLLLPGICAKQNQEKRKTCRIISCWNQTGCLQKSPCSQANGMTVKKWWRGTKGTLHTWVQCDNQKANTSKVLPYSKRSNRNSSQLLWQQWEFLSQLSQRTSSPEEAPRQPDTKSHLESWECPISVIITLIHFCFPRRFSNEGAAVLKCFST